MAVWLETAHNLGISQGISQMVYINADAVKTFGFIKYNVSLGVDKWVVLADGIELTGDYSTVQAAVNAIQDLTEGKTLAQMIS